MKHFVLTILLLCLPLLSAAQLPMHGWRVHFAYSDVQQIEQTPERIYAVSENALFSVDKYEGDMQYYSKLTGLTGTAVSAIRYDSETQMLIILYKDGNIDLMNAEEEVSNVPDMYNTQSNITKEVNSITVHAGMAYLAMDFGIVVLNVQKQEIADTYYIGQNATAVDVCAIDVMHDTIYAASADAVYYAPLQTNLVDYSNWKTISSLPSSEPVTDMACFRDSVYVLCDTALYSQDGDGWRRILAEKHITTLEHADEKLFVMTDKSAYVFHIGDTKPSWLDLFYNSRDMAYEEGRHVYWFAARGRGVGQYFPITNTRDEFRPSGPVANIPYRLRYQNDRLFMVPGGYLGVYYDRDGMLSYYEDGGWTNFDQSYFMNAARIGHHTQDYVDIAVDPADKHHFYVASFGYGLIEFREDAYYQRYMPDNSPLESQLLNEVEKYTWVDGLTYDAAGNLWMLNPAYAGVKVLKPTEEWVSISNAATRNHSRTKDLLISNTNPNLKIVVNSYVDTGIGVFDDNGSIDNQSDDKSAFHNKFTDNFGNILSYDVFYCAAQDLDGGLWLGTSNGVLYFPTPADLLNGNDCRRITISRTDGSGLADYFLNEERVQAIAVDGANRVWFGTQSSGIYLMSFADMSAPEEIHHYTVDNSPLLSNEILSIAIDPGSGEVFIGTGNGLLSFQSDAAEAKEDYSAVYAYPNPVRQDFQGVITIAGLMEDSSVKITDNAGNLVCETRSNGGVAVWDGKDMQGRRVRTGVYMAMCLSADGGEHTLVKILILN